MPKAPKDAAATVPAHFAETPPPAQQPSGDFSYSLEVVMGMQKTLGELTQAVKTLTDDSKETRKKLDRLSHIIYAASAVVTIGTAIFIFLANKLADVFVATLKH